jgi:molybdenum cofactor cytidylyltransferase
MRIAGVVLAAGESRRMGQLKALLPFGCRTVIEQVLQPLLSAELSEVAVVLGHRADEIAAVLEPLPVRLLYNADYRLGMTTSVQVALRSLEPVPNAYLLALVDQPQIGPPVVQRLLAAHVRTRKGLVIPVWKGKRGHPLLFAAAYRPAVLALGPDQGLNVVTRGYPHDTLELPIENDDILRDMDYREDYVAELRRWQSKSSHSRPPGAPGSPGD